MNSCICKEKDFFEICRNAGLSDENINKVIEHSKSLIRVKYVDPDFPTIHISDNGNWIDLKCTKDYEIKQGESAFISLGVAMKLPKDYEAHLLPRSGTFKKYGLMQTNGTGIIDNSYSGNDDIWMMQVYATRDTFVKKGERLCQFRLFRTMEAELCDIREDDLSWFTTFGSKQIIILEVEELDDVNRGGFGSSGR